MSTLLALENQRRSVPPGQARRLSSGPPSEQMTLVRTVLTPGGLHLCCEVERA